MRLGDTWGGGVWERRSFPTLLPYAFPSRSWQWPPTPKSVLPAPLLDRKSTRLNSSHPSISTLFPYTTLFRSDGVSRLKGAGGHSELLGDGDVGVGCVWGIRGGEASGSDVVSLRFSRTHSPHALGSGRPHPNQSSQHRC